MSFTKNKILEWSGAITAIIYSVLVAMNIGAEFIGFILLAAAEITVRYSGISWTYTAIYYLIPIGMIPLFYFVLIRKFKYKNLYN